MLKTEKFPFPLEEFLKSANFLINHNKNEDLGLLPMYFFPVLLIRQIFVKWKNGSWYRYDFCIVITAEM